MEGIVEAVKALRKYGADPALKGICDPSFSLCG